MICKTKRVPKAYEQAIDGQLPFGKRSQKLITQPIKYCKIKPHRKRDKFTAVDVLPEYEIGNIEFNHE